MQDIDGSPWHQCMKQDLHLVVQHWTNLSMLWGDMMVHFTWSQWKGEFSYHAWDYFVLSVCFLIMFHSKRGVFKNNDHLPVRIPQTTRNHRYNIPNYLSATTHNTTFLIKSSLQIWSSSMILTLCRRSLIILVHLNLLIREIKRYLSNTRKYTWLTIKKVVKNKINNNNNYNYSNNNYHVIISYTTRHAVHTSQPEILVATMPYIM